MRIRYYPKMYQCSLCGRVDSKTYQDARKGKLIAICEQCTQTKRKMVL
jgi:transcription elongation factor Elf1